MESKISFSRPCDAPGYDWLVAALAPGATDIELTDAVWRDVAPLLDYHRVTGLLYARIEAGAVSAPRTLRYILSAQLLRWSARTATWPLQARVALEALQDRHIPHLVLKGWALIPLLHDGRRELRQAGDMDILVPASHRIAADAALRSQGFSIPPQAELRPGFAHAFHQQAPYVRIDECQDARNAFVVDLHWRLFDPPEFTARLGADWFDRARSVAFDGRELPIPAAEDLFLHVCAHTFLKPIQGATQLYNLLDLFRLVTHPDLRWETTLARARIQGWTGSLQAAMEALDTLWPGHLPAGWVGDARALAPSPAECRFLRRRIAARSLRFAYLKCLPNWRARFRYLYGRFFPSRAYLHLRCRLPERATYLRILCARYARALRRILGKKRGSAL